MAVKEIKVVAESREELGTGEVRRLRHTGTVPAVVYGESNAVRLIKLNEHAFEQMLRHHASEHLVLDLEIDGTPIKALMKEVQHHPVTGRVLHVDFQEISLSKKIRVSLPLELVGDPVGVSQQGGVLEHLMREVEVECLPMDVMESIVVDVSGMDINTRMTVKEINLDASKYTIVTNGDVAFAAVMPPRLQAETAAAEGEEAVAVAAAAPAEKTEDKGGDKKASK